MLLSSDNHSDTIILLHLSLCRHHWREQSELLTPKPICPLLPCKNSLQGEIPWDKHRPLHLKSNGSHVCRHRHLATARTLGLRNSFELYLCTCSIPVLLWLFQSSFFASEAWFNIWVSQTTQTWSHHGLTAAQYEHKEQEKDYCLELDEQTW